MAAPQYKIIITNKVLLASLKEGMPEVILRYNAA